jgi:hypothetical protein
MIANKLHNPDKLTPKQYGEIKGYRLLYESEIKRKRVFVQGLERYERGYSLDSFWVKGGFW